MKTWRFQAACFIALAAALACTLNPQPIPPEMFGPGGSDSGTSHDASKNGMEVDASAPDVVDAATEAETPIDAETDASVDAPSDGG